MCHIQQKFTYFKTLKTYIIWFYNILIAGAIYVVDELDYEQKQSYELVIRATDSVSGVSGECLN